MSAQRQTLQLRFELLRLRAQIEREELAAAVRDLRASTRQLRRIGAVAGQVGSVASGRSGGWLSAVAGALLERPWLASLAVTVLRAVRRHPAVAFGLALAAVAALRWGLRPATPDTAAGATEPADSVPDETADSVAASPGAATAMPQTRTAEI
jgi:hypothetical protein